MYLGTDSTELHGIFFGENKMQLAKISASQTMSSLEIAELTGKRHDHVLADIRKTLEEAEIEATEFLGAYKMPSGQTATVYNLPRRECDLVVSGYSVKYRLAIIDRWQELESMQNQPQFKVPQSFADALLLAGAQQKEIEQKTLQIENLSTALDTLLDWVSILKIAKHNKVSEKKFDWRKLKTTSEQLGYIIKKAESPRFGYQNLYHVNVFKACYPKFNYSFSE